MKKHTDPERNRAAENGGDHDPELRGSSAAQPGVGTVSGGPADEANEELSRSVGGNFGDRIDREKADRSFDDPEGE